MGILRHGQFIRLWLAQVVSQFGDAITEVAIIVLIAVSFNNAWLVGLVLFAQLLPSAVLGAFMGPLADRFSPKWLMVGCDLYRMCIVLSMIASVNHPLFLIFLVALHGVGSSLFAPARSATIPQVVGDDNVAQAIAVSQATWSAMRIAGPATGGFLLAIHNTDLIFILDACTFAASAILIASLRAVRALAAGSKQSESYLNALHAGIQQVVGMPVLRFLLLLFIPVTLSAGVFNTTYNVALLQVFQVPRLHFGMLESTAATGAILGALCAPVILKRCRPSTMLLTTCGLLGVSFILILGLNEWRFSLGLAPIYIWTILTGLLNAMINVALSSLFVSIIPAEYRGRGAAVLQAVVNVGVIVGVLSGGWFSSVWDALTATTMAGIILVLTALVYPWLHGYKSLHAVTVKKRTEAPVATAPIPNGETANVESEATT
jgi:DHA3 family macrolide efflux protein-like MFS transporter